MSHTFGIDILTFKIYKKIFPVLWTKQIQLFEILCRKLGITVSQVTENSWFALYDERWEVYKSPQIYGDLFQKEDTAIWIVLNNCIGKDDESEKFQGGQNVCDKCDLFFMKQESQINTDTESFTVSSLLEKTYFCNITELLTLFWSKILLWCNCYVHPQNLCLCFQTHPQKSCNWCNRHRLHC